MRAPRFTDSDKHRQPYVPAEQTKAEGYLREKFLRMYPGCFDIPQPAQPKPIIKLKAKAA